MPRANLRPSFLSISRWHSGKPLLLQKRTTTSLSQSDMNNEDPPYKKIHQQAVKNGDHTYNDPATQYVVFTELAHLDRGYCCGNKCRHCPFNHENVGKPEVVQREKEKRGEK